MNTVKTWAIDTASRCVKTFAQALAGLLSFGAIVPTVAQHVSWHDDLSISGLTALACLLQNIQSFPTGAIDGTGTMAVGADPVGSDLESGWVGPNTSPEASDGADLVGTTPTPAPVPPSLIPPAVLTPVAVSGVGTEAPQGA